MNKIYQALQTAVVMPTETVYGLFTLENFDFIYECKKRPKNKQLCKYLPPNHDFVPKFNDLLQEYRVTLPGPITVIYQQQGYRISSNRWLNEVLETFGPLYGTSANLSGYNPITSSIHNRLDVLVYAPECRCNLQIINNLVEISGCPCRSECGLESTILDLDMGKVLRMGYTPIPGNTENITDVQKLGLDGNITDVQKTCHLNPDPIIAAKDFWFAKNSNIDFGTIGAPDDHYLWSLMLNCGTHSLN